MTARRNPRPKLAMLALLLAAGCGPTQGPIVPRAPHGGTLADIPDGRGIVEVVREDPADKPGQSRITAYFLDKQMQPLAPAPASATFKAKARGAAAVELKPGDGGGLASTPFPAPGGIDGELTATLDGKPAVVPLSIR